MDEKFEQRVKEFVKKAKEAGLDPITINSFIKNRYKDHLDERAAAWSLITDEDGNPVGRFNSVTGVAEPLDQNFSGSNDSGWGSILEEMGQETETSTTVPTVSGPTIDENGQIQKVSTEPTVLDKVAEAEQKPTGNWFWQQKKEKGEDPRSDLDIGSLDLGSGWANPYSDFKADSLTLPKKQKLKL